MVNKRSLQVEQNSPKVCPELSFFIGAMVGDGSYRQYGPKDRPCVRFFVKDIEFAKAVQKGIQTAYDEPDSFPMLHSKQVKDGSILEVVFGTVCPY